jgi:hypothetical protein
MQKKSAPEQGVAVSFRQGVQVLVVEDAVVIRAYISDA